MEKIDRSVYVLFAGDVITLHANVDAVVFYLPVRVFFQQYEQLKAIFLSELKNHD